MRYVILPACSGSAPGSHPSLTCSENLQREAPRRHPQIPEPPQLAPFNVRQQQFYFSLSGMFVLLMLSQVSYSHSLEKKTKKNLILAACIYILFFWSLPKARGHR
ncbi:hypothetical protein LDENG_00077880 [Lucifuga dentata]|nr:hypothetical protein LDENG_00077880 [Lucifuga dentata]